MKYLLALSISLFSLSLVGMDKPALPVSLVDRDLTPKTVIFKIKNEKVEIPYQMVEAIPALHTAYASYKLGCSIGTGGDVPLYKPELQNIDLVKKCLSYKDQSFREIKCDLIDKSSDIAYLIKVIDMAEEFHMRKVSEVIAEIIATNFQTAKSRCEAFKTGQLAQLSDKSEILNLIGQAILDVKEPVKQYWIDQTSNKNNALDIKEQLDNYLKPQTALLLLDAYEHKVNKHPISYAPGAEIEMPTVLRDLVKLNYTQTVSYKWKQLKPAYKWTIAGLGIASVAAAGYGLWNWYTSK